MVARSSSARWQGDLKGGSGSMRLGSGAFEGQFSAPSRFEDGSGTNPEELIAAAHAGCFSMAFAHGLSQAGFTPTSIETTAKVNLKQVEGGFAIDRIDLTTVGQVPNIDEATFKEQADAAKKGCPVSKVLAGAEISLDAKLK